MAESQSVIYVRMAKGPLPSVVNHNWFDHWYQDEEKSVLAFAIARLDGKYLLHYPGLADFVVDVHHSQIQCHRVSGVPDETLRHLLLDQVIPRVQGQRGNLVLHASAVSIGDCGIVFLGKSGWGKSTLASSLHQDGARLISDDCILLDTRNGRAIGFPAYAGARLWQDSADSIFPDRADLINVTHYSHKKRLILHAEENAARPTFLEAIFLLNDPKVGSPNQGITIEPLHGAEAMMSLIKLAFLLDVEDMAAVSRQFDCVSRIVAAHPATYKLAYPRDFAQVHHLNAEINLVLNSLVKRVGVRN